MLSFKEFIRKASDDFNEEFFGNPKFAQMIGGSIKKVRNVRESVNKNIRFFMNALNLPSQEDYKDLLGRIDLMNKSLNDLESRIDDLIAASDRLARKGRSPKGD